MKRHSPNLGKKLSLAGPINATSLYFSRPVAEDTAIPDWSASSGAIRPDTSVPVHFLHIRKTGGTAIAEALRPVSQRYGLVLHGHSTKLCDVPGEHSVVFFVRHPIPRFVSGFFSRMRRGQPRHHYEWNEAEEKAFRDFQSANDLAEALSAADHDRAQQAREAMQGISHVKSTYRDWFDGTRELDERLNSVVLVGLQETLGRDFEHLKRWLSLPQEITLPEDDTLAHRTPPEFDRHLSPLAVQNLSKWYADDLRFYDHCLQLRTARGLLPAV